MERQSQTYNPEVIVYCGGKFADGEITGIEATYILRMSRKEWFIAATR